MDMLEILKGRFQQKEKQLWIDIERDYGRYTTTIFKKTKDAFRPPGADSDSRNVLIEMIAQKLMAAMDGSKEKLVWTTVGDSLAAGHGNLPWETYTAILSKRVQPLLAELGISFSARNHGMLGSSSAPEPSICADSFYGRDTDILAWDAGMTDGPDPFPMGFFMAGAYHSFQPFLLALGNTNISDQRRGVLQTLEKWGMPILYQNSEATSNMIRRIPDSHGDDPDFVKSMPKMVSGLKCAAKLEQLDCREQKWNNKICKGRKFQFGWHNGYKTHALFGSFYALFLTDIVREAIDFLQSKVSDWKKLPKELSLAREQRIAKVRASHPPGWVRERTMAKVEDIDPNMLINTPHLCHTARLPSQIRAEGILMSKPAIPHGVSVTSRDPEMKLTFNGLEREYCGERLVRHDYDDYFLVGTKESSAEGFIEIPNANEITNYPAMDKLRGLINVCLARCHFMTGCIDGELRSADVSSRLTVNSVQVTAVHHWTKEAPNPKSSECFFLRHEGGFVFPSQTGKFRISATAPAGRIWRFSSFTVW